MKGENGIEKQSWHLAGPPPSLVRGKAQKESFFTGTGEWDKAGGRTGVLKEVQLLSAHRCEMTAITPKFHQHLARVFFVTCRCLSLANRHSQGDFRISRASLKCVSGSRQMFECQPLTLSALLSVLLWIAIRDSSWHDAPERAVSK